MFAGGDRWSTIRSPSIVCKRHHSYSAYLYNVRPPAALLVSSSSLSPYSSSSSFFLLHVQL